MDAERRRLDEDRAGTRPWRLWGAYLGERQWGTVREDYSADGEAWSYLTHDMARSRAYRWGEDGLLGLCDDHQWLCFSLALWNGRDPFLKERLFGLSGPEGNHGEDVKERYDYLDATPTHSWLRARYRYPQREFPYAALVRENGRRPRVQPEFELGETGIFAEDRWFDVGVEYAKAGPKDLLIRITARNRGPEPAELHLVPQLVFRNVWAWGDPCRKPEIVLETPRALGLTHERLGRYACAFEGQPRVLFCENESNARRLFGVNEARGPFKDAFHEAIVEGREGALASEPRGTKAALAHSRMLDPEESWAIRLRLSEAMPSEPFEGFDETVAERRGEADAFYASLQRGCDDEEARRIQRRALAGMIWTEQYYEFDVERWLQGDPGQPPPPAERRRGRNHQWRHLKHADVLSMPDKWEYPWYAAWDLAFHCLPLALVDPDFAKRQLLSLVSESYMHPNGQLPAYEWAFDDVNPPVHAWAAWRLYRIDRERNGGRGDRVFLERMFHKLVLNFTWWVNRKDHEDNNLFQGGFLGLDNIGVFDRSRELPVRGHLEQSDGTAWMAMYSLNLMRIALELSLENPVYQHMASKFFEHFLYIAAAMRNVGGEGVDLWDPEDEFYYDVLHLTELEGGARRTIPLKVRSLVGLIPLFAVEVIEPETIERCSEFGRRLTWFLDNRPDLAGLVSRWHEPGRGDLRLLSLLRGHRMKCLLRRMLDPGEFLSDHGIRSLSRFHRDHPYTLEVHGDTHVVRYLPAESDSAMFGGNSNWRGPIWLPMNYLAIGSLRRFHQYYGDEFLVECPTGSGRRATLAAIADELTRRLIGLFRGHDPEEGPLFHEYFDGDDGHGLGASHQTGWTGLVALLLDEQTRRAAP